ncbi:hypothetical protein [Neosynechococcus sphagnicola]|uniref:hypothetical protein n=1 Tax=Neosynechococcus sphagnicola TaxID=1501145 RepID=UPI0012E06F7B|nr:hypothetical protein [Neosynechococcus sphagnicola]
MELGHHRASSQGTVQAVDLQTGHIQAAGQEMETGQTLATGQTTAMGQTPATGQATGREDWGLATAAAA